jgi:hypothetical protein
MTRSHTVPHRARSRYLLVLVCLLVVLNIFTFVYHLSAAVVFNLLGDVTSVVLIPYSAWALVSRAGRISASFGLIVWPTLLIGLSFLANIAVASPIDSLKYLAIYIFYAAGRALPGRSTMAETTGLYVLAALPIAFMAIGSSRIYPPGSMAYLPNANTMALYFSSVLFALAPRLKSGSLILQFINAALMNKVGPAVATIAAIAIWLLVPLRKSSVIIAIIIALSIPAGVIAHMLGAFDRLVIAYQNISLIIQLEPGTIAAMPYKALVELTGTKDLSAFFRVIHWANIWDVYSSRGVMTFLFGYGAGQTKVLAYSPLPPHNDYLRVLAEYGAINLACFVMFLWRVVSGMRLMQARVLFIVLLIYMFSENLLDNFTSMALYFAFAGRMAAPELRLVPRPGERIIERDASDVSTTTA